MPLEYVCDRKLTYREEPTLRRELFFKQLSLRLFQQADLTNDTTECGSID